MSETRVHLIRDLGPERFVRTYCGKEGKESWSKIGVEYETAKGYLFEACKFSKPLLATCETCLRVERRWPHPERAP